MDYIKEAEKYLYNYQDLKRSIKTMERRILQLVEKTGPKDITAINLDTTGIKAGKYDETINILFEIQKLQQSINETKAKLKEIDQLLDEMSNNPKRQMWGKVLKLWYIEGKTKEEIAEELGYSDRRNIYYLRDPAIRTFAVNILGIEGLKVI